MGEARRKSAYYRALACDHARTIRMQRKIIAIQRELLAKYTHAGPSEPLKNILGPITGAKRT